MKNLAIVILVTTFSFFGAKAQDLKSKPYVDVSDMVLFPPKLDSNDASSITENTPGPTINFSHINGKDDTSSLNKEIDRLTKGGTINIAAGTYVFESVNIKSNIRLNFAAGVVVKIPAGKDGFYIGHDPGEARVENVKFIGNGSVASRPKFVLERNDTKVTRLMQIGYAYNVLIHYYPKV